MAEGGGGAITGKEGTAMLRAVLGLPHDRSFDAIKGNEPKISENPGSTNLPFIKLIGQLASAANPKERSRVRVLLVTALLNDHYATQFQETGGYTETWAFVRGALLWEASKEVNSTLLPATLEFVRRGALLGCLCNLEGTIAMVGGRAQRCGGHVVQEVCTAMLIGMPVKKSQKWWENDGNSGALLLGVWLQEHGRDEIFTPRERAELRSWVLHGTVPKIMSELRLHPAVEVRRWSDRLVAWTPNGVRSYERDGKSPNHPLVISDIASYRSPLCHIAAGGPEVSLAAGGTRLGVDPIFQWQIPTVDHKTALSWSGSAWSMNGDETVIETEEAPLPAVSREWLPKGGGDRSWAGGEGAELGQGSSPARDAGQKSSHGPRSHE